MKRLCWSETTLGPLWEIWILKKLPRDGRVGESQTGVSAAGRDSTALGKAVLPLNNVHVTQL